MSDKNAKQKTEAGIVYVVKNPSFKEDIVKIGLTRNLPQRLKDLSGSNVPEPYQCLYACEVKNCREVEKALHGICQPFNAAKEFFRVDPKPVINLLKQVAIRECTIDVDRAIESKLESEKRKDEKKAKEVTAKKDIPDGYKPYNALKQFLAPPSGFRPGYFATRVLASHKWKRVTYYLHQGTIYYNEQIFLEQANSENILDPNKASFFKSSQQELFG